MQKVYRKNGFCGRDGLKDIALSKDVDGEQRYGLIGMVHSVDALSTFRNRLSKDGNAMIQIRLSSLFAVSLFLLVSGCQQPLVTQWPVDSDSSSLSESTRGNNPAQRLRTAWEKRASRIAAMTSRRKTVHEQVVSAESMTIPGKQDQPVRIDSRSLANAYGQRSSRDSLTEETYRSNTPGRAVALSRQDRLSAEKEQTVETDQESRLLILADALAEEKSPAVQKDIHLTDYLQVPPAPDSSDDKADPFTPPPMPNQELPTGDQTAEPRMALTIDQAVSIALANNPTLAQANWTVRKALGVQYQVGRYPNPSVGYVGDEIGDMGSAGNQGVFLSQMIVLGKKLKLNERVAAQTAEALRWQAEAQRFRVRNDVRSLYYQALGAQERVKLAKELHRIAEEGVRNTKQLQEAQEASKPDVLQAEIQLREVDILQKNALFAYEAAWEQLALVMGRPGLSKQYLDDELELEESPRDFDTALGQLLAMSPELAQAKANVETARRQIEREQAQPIPNLNVQLGAAYLDTSDSNSLNLQIGLPLPIFNKNKGNISRAHAEYQRACWNVRRLELRLQSELARAFQQYQQAWNRVETYRLEIIPREQETLQLIESAYPIQFGFLRLLSARQSYFQARMEYLSALVELRQAEVNLDGLLLKGALENNTNTMINDGNRSKSFNGR